MISSWNLASAMQYMAIGDDIMMKEIRLTVEPSQFTSTGYLVVIRWTHDGGLNYRESAFTSWKSMLKFLGGQSIDTFKIVVRSKINSSSSL
jgi:hypothetical protein